MRNFICVVACAVALAACASIVAGTDQEIMVASDPSDADCKLYQGDKLVGQVKTPGPVTVSRRKEDLRIVCAKEEYYETTFVNDSGAQGTTAGNLGFAIGTLGIGALIGWGVDSATGADNEYSDSVIVHLSPLSGPAPAIQYSVAPKEEKEKSKVPDYPN